LGNKVFGLVSEVATDFFGSEECQTTAILKLIWVVANNWHSARQELAPDHRSDDNLDNSIWTLLIISTLLVNLGYFRSLSKKCQDIYYIFVYVLLECKR
jgi:hypothetical protein